MTSHAEDPLSNVTKSDGRRLLNVTTDKVMCQFSVLTDGLRIKVNLSFLLYGQASVRGPSVDSVNACAARGWFCLVGVKCNWDKNSLNYMTSMNSNFRTIDGHCLRSYYEVK